MTELKGLPLWRRMTQRATRHDYDTGDFWNALDDAADAVEDLQTYVQIIEDAIAATPEDFMLRADFMQRLKEVREKLGFEENRDELI